MAARQPVEAPPIQPPLYGLIAAAPTVTDASLRWGGSGFAYEPEACGVSGVAEIGCGGSSIFDEVPGRQELVEGDAFVVWAGDECSTFGASVHDFRGRAQRQLEATRSYQIASEVWNGTLRTAQGLVNRSLIDNDDVDVVTGAASSVADAFGCVELGLAHYLHGSRGMIHCSPDVLVHAVLANMLRWQGGVWVSPMGHVVVADAGYESAAGPGGAPGRWIYGTNTVQLRLGEVSILPSDSDEGMQMAQAMDRSINSIRYIAMQAVAASWDRCAHVAAEVNVPACAIDVGG